MTWLQRLGDLLFGEIPQPGTTANGPIPPAGEAGPGWSTPIPQNGLTTPGYAAGIVEASTTLQDEDRGWRNVSTTGILEPAWSDIQADMLDAAEAYRANPLAFRIVELTVDHVLGKGVRLTTKDRALQRWLDAWWKHPENRMQTRAYDLCRELSLSGEVFITYHPDPASGMVYLRQIPPPHVDEIQTDPDDLERELRFHQSGATADPGGRWWDASRCSHYAINRLPGCTRGQSDLVTILPWLRRYKDWLTDRVRINRFKGAFLWWVKLAGADRATLEMRKLELAQPPRPGSVIVTNESEEWTAVQPQIDAQAVEPDGRAMRIMLAAGAGVPLHFLAEPEHTNRATAAEMHGPTLRHFENRQLMVGAVLCDIARRAALLSGRFPKVAEINAIFEDLTTVDNLKIAQAASSMVTALSVARDRDWITDETAKATLRAYIGLKQEGTN